MENFRFVVLNFPLENFEMRMCQYVGEMGRVFLKEGFAVHFET